MKNGIFDEEECVSYQQLKECFTERSNFAHIPSSDSSHHNSRLEND